MASEDCDTYINDLVDFPETSNGKKKSEVAEFFAGANILVTGGTGFLGILLIEKLLRCCPDLSKIYMLVRSKKGKTPEERFKEIFSSVVYEPLARERPDFLKKVIMVESEIAAPDCGLSEESKKMMMDTNVIFHAAAIVRFDETLRTVTCSNIKSTKFLLTYAKQLPNFKVFVHVSTAFSNCVKTVIEETHYKDIIDADKLMTLVDVLDDEKLQQITPVLLEKRPNTYVLSKAVAENTVLKYSDDLAVCIVRPSIVISTYKEPILAWTNNLYGATGVVVGSAVGLIRTLHCVSEYIADVIPADYVISNIICSAWDTYNRKAARKPDQNSNLPDAEKVPVYNCVSSCQNPISWGEFMHKNEVFSKGLYSDKVMWYYMLLLNRYLIVHTLCGFFLHIVPAAIVDTIVYLRGGKPMCLETYRKINKFSAVVSYFTLRQWKFRNDNVVKLWEKMNPTDKETFCFHVGTIDWNEYFYHHLRGLRTYMLKEGKEPVEVTKRRYVRLRTAHYTLVTVIAVLLLWLGWTFLSFLWSLCPLAH